MKGVRGDVKARVRERAREERELLCGERLLTVDTLHRALECARCRRVSFDTRVFEGGLALVEGGERTVDDVVELGEALRSYLQYTVGEPPSGCECGVPWTALEPVGLWFFHDVAGSGATLVVEVNREGVSFASVTHGGPWRWLAPTETAVNERFGVPFTLTHTWQELIDGGGDKTLEIEAGYSLGVASEVSSVEALRGERRVTVLSARAVAAPAWAWLRARGDLGEIASKLLFSLADREEFFVRVRSIALRAGVTARAEGDVFWIEDGLVAWPIEFAPVLDEAMRVSIGLSGAAVTAVAVALDRLGPQREFVKAIGVLRPGVLLRREAMALVPSMGERVGRAFDLSTAPYGGVADVTALERDLRFHLDEPAPWVDLSRVCPCGAHRSASLRWVTEGKFSAMSAKGEGRGVSLVESFFRDGEVIARVCTVLECDRHVDYAVDEIDGLEAAIERGEREAKFGFRVAWHTDGHGRKIALAQGPVLASALLRRAWRRGLCEAIGADEEVWLEAVTRDTVIVGEQNVDTEFASRLATVGVMLASHNGLDATRLGVRFDAAVGATVNGVFTVEG